MGHDFLLIQEQSEQRKIAGGLVILGLVLLVHSLPSTVQRVISTGGQTALSLRQVNLPAHSGGPLKPAVSSDKATRLGWLAVGFPKV